MARKMSLSGGCLGKLAAIAQAQYPGFHGIFPRVETYHRPIAQLGRNVLPESEVIKDLAMSRKIQASGTVGTQLLPRSRGETGDRKDH